jgi:hypothetical protein
MAFDYILLLGVLLGAADLAYVEAQFTPLGPAWPWHLLIVSALSAGIALRCDSRIVFSFALSSFAAWRGVSVSLAEGARWLFRDAPDSLRDNALGVGVLFLGIGLLLLRTRRKPHFEPVATPFGCALVLGALFSGLDSRTGVGLAWAWATLAAGAALAGWGWRARRFLLLAMGVVGGYVGLSALAQRVDLGDTLTAAWYLASSVGLVIGLFFAHHHLKEDT